MKQLLLITLLAPLFVIGQTTRTTSASGDFFNPFIWNPIGIPASGDSLFINHVIVLNGDIYYTSGRITINGTGSLIEDIDRSFWADGTGSVVNSGTFTTHLLLISPSAGFTNYGNFIDIDSLWNQGSITNTNSGNAELYDFWNDQTGVFYNDGMLSNADSVLNQGIFVNNTGATVNAMLNDEMGSFTNNGNMTINQDMNNQGLMSNEENLEIGHDFSNCNLQTLDAILYNNGKLCITNNFANCIDDTLRGTGQYYVGGASSNFGVFDGAFTFYTTDGTMGFSGNLQGGATIAQGTCNVGVEEDQTATLEVYPNPTEGELTISKKGLNFQLIDVTGKCVAKGITGTLDFSTMKKGVYFLKIEGESTRRIVKL